MSGSGGGWSVSVARSLVVTLMPKDRDRQRLVDGEGANFSAAGANVNAMASFAESIATCRHSTTIQPVEGITTLDIIFVNNL